MNTKRNTKDSIFTNLFSDPIYQLQLYKELNLDSEDITIDDIQDVTLENIFTIQQMNDLGFIVKDKILFLVEAQSTWTENILLRMLFYYFETLKRRIAEYNLNVYSSKIIPVLKPKFYVIYTGNKNISETITFKDIYFKEDSDLDLNAKVHIIHKTDDCKTISSQYIRFSNIFDDQRKIYGYSKKTIEETLRICKNEDILKSYIESKESEVIDIMSYFMDQEKVTELTMRDIKEQAEIEGRKIGEIEGRKIGEIEGRKIGELNAYTSLIKDGLLSVEECLKRTGLSEEEFYKMYPELK